MVLPAILSMINPKVKLSTSVGAILS